MSNKIYNLLAAREVTMESHQAESAAFDLVDGDPSVVMEMLIHQADQAGEQMELLQETKALVQESPEVSEGMLKAIQVQVANAESFGKMSTKLSNRATMESLAKHKPSNKVIAMESLGLSIKLLIPVIVAISFIVGYFLLSNKKSEGSASEKADDLDKSIKTLDSALKESDDIQEVRKELETWGASSAKREDASINLASDQLALGESSKTIRLSDIVDVANEGSVLAPISKVSVQVAESIYKDIKDIASQARSGELSEGAIKHLSDTCDTFSDRLISALTSSMSASALSAYSGADELINTGEEIQAYFALDKSTGVAICKKKDNSNTYISRVIRPIEKGTPAVDKEVFDKIENYGKGLKDAMRLLESIEKDSRTRTAIVSRYEKSITADLEAAARSQDTDSNAAQGVAEIRRAFNRVGELFKIVNQCIMVYSSYAYASINLAETIVNKKTSIVKKSNRRNASKKD